MEKNDIILIHGTNYKVMAKKVMEAANVAEDIGDKKKENRVKAESGHRQGPFQRRYHPQRAVGGCH